MVGLLILKHVRNLSDENLVEQWSENIYYEYFCGQNEFVSKIPCVPTELVMFRQRVGIEGCELILKESIRINGKDGDEPDVSADTTVQEKNITYPTDNKLHRKIISKCKKIAKQEDVPLRQTYTHTLKKLYVDIRSNNHPKNKKKARAASRKIKTIAGRLVRELECKLPDNHNYKDSLDLFTKVLKQKRSDKIKFTVYMNQECFVFQREKNIKNMSLVTKFLFFTLKTLALYLEPYHLKMDTMAHITQSFRAIPKN